MNPFDQFDNGNPFDQFDATPNTVTPAEYTADVLRKFKQGASLGFGDELSGALKATLGGRGAVGDTWTERYQNARDYERAAQEKASRDAPVSSFIAEMAGSIAPSIAAGGIAGLAGGAGRAATTTLPAVRNAALPAVRSAAGGIGEAMGTGAIVGAVQGVGDTEDMMDAPLAAVRGGFVGSLGGAAGYGAGNLLQRLSRFTNTASRVADAPTTEQIKNAAQAGYDAFENAGGLFTQKGLNDLAKNTRTALSDMGYQPELGPKVAAFTRAMERARTGSGAPTGTANLMQTATPKQIQNLRKIAGKIRNSSDDTESAYGSALIDEIDNFLSNIQPGQYAAPPGVTSDLGKDLAKANELWTQYSKADAVDNALWRVENRAASTYSGGNENNAIRQDLRRIWEKRGTERFTPDENAAFQTAVRGGRAENITRGIGKLAASRGGVMSLLNLGGMYAAPGLAMPLSIAAEGMKYLGDRLTRRNLDEVSRVIRSGGKRRPIAVKPNAIERAAARLPQGLAGPAAQFGVSIMPGLLGP